jgi:hypothetical protein
MPELTEAEDLEYYRTVNHCPSVKVNDEDVAQVEGYSIYVYENGIQSRVKGKVQFSPWQFRQLLKQMVEDGLEIKDWSCVDLSGWVEE